MRPIAAAVAFASALVLLLPYFFAHDALCRPRIGRFRTEQRDGLVASCQLGAEPVACEVKGFCLRVFSRLHAVAWVGLIRCVHALHQSHGEVRCIDAWLSFDVDQ